MLRRRLLLGLGSSFLAAPALALSEARRRVLLAPPVWAMRGASIDFDFALSRYYQSGVPSEFERLITTSRASTGTNLLPTSASGYAYSTFGANVARVTPGLGLLVEEARTNSLLNSTAPVTQTTASLGTGTYTLWVNGSGSATSSAGTATGSGFGGATQGTPNVFTLTGAGTATVTVAGSLNAFQLEAGAFGTSLIVTAGATATRAADVVTVTAPPVFGSAYSLFAQVTPLAPDNYGVTQGLLVISDGTITNRFGLLRLLTTGVASGVLVMGGAATTPQVSSWAQNLTNKIAGACVSGLQTAAFNGSVSSQAVALVPEGAILNTIAVGNRGDGAAAFANSYISRVAVWPRTFLLDADLQRIAA